MPPDMKTTMALSAITNTLGMRGLKPPKHLSPKVREVALIELSYMPRKRLVGLEPTTFRLQI